MGARSQATVRSYLADGLTVSRFVLSLLIIPLLMVGSWTATTILVAAAWWTDFFDGRVARSTTGSRLGPWDPHADTAVGLGVIAGLAGGGHLPGPAWWLVAGGVLTVAYLRTEVFALSETIQALAYGPLLWLTAINSPAGFLVLVATIGVILVLGFDRFRTHTLPSFFAGLRRLTRPGKR